MTVEINWARSWINREDGHGTLYLENDDADYAAWKFYEDSERVQEFNSTGDTVSWQWENPGCDVQDITLSPSLKYEGGIGPNFHIFIRNGEIQHCGDCQCGCD